MMMSLIRKLLVSLFILLSLMDTSVASDSKCELAKESGRSFLNKKESVQGAYNFLYRQMDQFHKSIVIYDEPDFSAYYPSGFMGADAALDVDIYDNSNPCFGLTSMRIDYDFNSDVRYNWAGIYFQYPDNNWGDLPGRSLKNAAQLSFWIRADKSTKVQFKLGGINQFPHHDPSMPHVDSLKPIWVQENSTKASEHQTKLSISTEWKQYIIKFDSVNDEQLESVIGIIAIIVDRDESQLNNSIYLDKMSVDIDRLEEPRFIQSFVAKNYLQEGSDKVHAINTAHTYDQALSILAFMARPDERNLKRARLIADALVEVQNNDSCFNDGRLRNGYASGDLTAPVRNSKKHKSVCKRKEVDKSSRLPGVWDKNKSMYKEDAYSVGSDVGNMAWAGIALIQLYEVLTKTPRQPTRKYLESSMKIGQWIINNNRIEQDDGFGGFRGGRDYKCDLSGHCYFIDSEWRSTEHNIDLFVLFSHLANQDSVRRNQWIENADHALAFVNKMWNTDGYYHTGTSVDSEKNEIVVNKNIIPIDAQSWATLAFKKRISTNGAERENLTEKNLKKALVWALRNCGDTKYGTNIYKSVNGFDFDCQADADGAWWEGTSQLAIALDLFKDGKADSELILGKVRRAQITNDGKSYGAIPASNSKNLTTGIKKWWGDWTYPNEPHIGATAWYLFAALNRNPYYLDE